jgi:hypothetical protein
MQQALMSVLQIVLFLIGMINSNPSRVTELQHIQAVVVQDLSQQTTSATSSPELSSSSSASAGAPIAPIETSSDSVGCATAIQDNLCATGSGEIMSVGYNGVLTPAPEGSTLHDNNASSTPVQSNIIPFNINQ